MKKILPFLFLFCCVFAQAQIVNIPDANFKDFLLTYVGNIDSNDDGEVQVSEALRVRSLFIDYNENILDFTGLEAFVNLESLSVDFMGYPGPEPNISLFTQLQSLNIGHYQGQDLNLSGLINLETVDIWNSYVTELDLSHAENLSFLRIDSYNLELINIGFKPALTSLDIQAPELMTLDLSGCPSLDYLMFQSFSISYINLKNGDNNYLSHSLLFGSRNCFVCLDEGEEIALGGDLILGECVYSTYCSFIPGGTYNIITGSVSLDSNNNNCDPGSRPLPFTPIQINDGFTTRISYMLEGGYNFFTNVSGTFTLTPQIENDWFTAAPATVSFTEVNNSTIVQNFCITANGVHNDVEVVIVPVVRARPGFDAIYKLVFKNKGNQTLSGDVSFNYDDAVLDYVSASTVPSSSATSTLTWGYSNLLPFESREIFITLNANGPTETPAANIDDTLTFLATITPATGDETPTDNIFVFNQTVVGSHDPNDITCLQGATVSPDKIGEYLHYNINFENTGTAPATFVVVKDVIDAAKYDINTLQILNASHAMEVRVTGSKIEFIFDDINLGATEKGNVTFKIKTLETLAVNSSVTQQADIFFDYNWPIQTNEATTTFAVLSKGDYASDNSVTVSPNPANGIVNISAKAEITSVQLYDVQGRLLQAAKGATIDVSNRATGLYFVKVMTNKGMKVEKLMKK